MSLNQLQKLSSFKIKKIKKTCRIKQNKCIDFNQIMWNHYKNKIPLQADMFQITQPEIYPGLCTLCSQNQHITVNCPFGLIFYHATNLNCLNSILQNGLHAKPGRLGKAVYFSDDPLMCVKYVSRNKTKFPQPILIKVKIMVDGKIKSLKHLNQIKDIKPEQIKKKNIQMIKCPYFTQFNNTKYEFALLNAQYVITSWGFINNQYSSHRQKKSIINIQNCEQNNVGIPIILEDQQKKIIDANQINTFQKKQQILQFPQVHAIDKQKIQLTANRLQIDENKQDQKQDSEFSNKKESIKPLKLYELNQNEGLGARKKIKKIKKIKDQLKKYNLRVRSNINYCYK